MEEVLNRTCDNLSRESLMASVESLDNFTAEESEGLQLPGVTVTITDDDHTATESMRFLRAKVVDGKGMWEYEGELISFR